MSSESSQRETTVKKDDAFKRTLAAMRVAGRNALMSISRAILSFIKWFTIRLTMSLIRYAVGMLVLIWLGNVFLESLREGAKEWDTYPNSSSHIVDAISERGPGEYNLVELMGMEISAVCISRSGDPRELASQELAFSDEFLDAAKNPYFVREGATSLIFLGDTNFKIESIDEDALAFDERRNRCVSRPRAVVLTVRPEKSHYSFAKYTATLSAE